MVVVKRKRREGNEKRIRESDPPAVTPSTSTSPSPSHSPL
jgi:hypothetical protein